jgi:hypothetical protein
MNHRFAAAAAGLAATGAVALAAAVPAGAQPPPPGKGTSLCVPVPPGVGDFAPAGGPLYNFAGPPPASPVAFNNLGCP